MGVMVPVGAPETAATHVRVTLIFPENIVLGVMVKVVVEPACHFTTSSM